MTRAPDYVYTGGLVNATIKKLAMSRFRFHPPMLWPLASIIALMVALAGCGQEQAAEMPEVVRGLKGYRITNTSGIEVRHYPSVVKPSQESKLSFEISGQLRAVELEIGQLIEKGDVLAEIDPVSLQLQVQQAEAALAQAEANLDSARSDFRRRATLLEKGYVTQSEYDGARSRLDGVLAQVEQARQQLSIHKQSLSKSRLIAPFEGTVSNIYVKDFQQVAAGQEIVAIYTEGAYKISFSVPAKVVNSVKLGDIARVQFSDLSQLFYEGVITELGSRAEQVSAFPVVVTIVDAPPGLRAGMAADVELDIPLAYGVEGFLIPMRSIDVRHINAGVDRQDRAIVYVFDKTTSTVVAREVVVAGLLENRIIVSEGVSDGDIIASAGVSYLHDGMKVFLLPLAQ